MACAAMGNAFCDGDKYCAAGMMTAPALLAVGLASPIGFVGTLVYGAGAVLATVGVFSIVDGLEATEFEKSLPQWAKTAIGVSLLFATAFVGAGLVAAFGYPITFTATILAGAISLAVFFGLVCLSDS